MAESKVNKKRPSITLSLFAHNDQNLKSTTKSPKNFEEPNGVVGLGIVAALNDLDQTHDPFSPAKSSRAAILAISPRSNPIPILTKTFSNGSAKLGKIGGPNLGDVELSEGYTCVISHIGKNLIKKKEYFDGDLGYVSESTTSYWVSAGVFSASSPPVMGDSTDGSAFQTADFLNSCYLCKKLLHGLDIFIYRGEKAFCSAECRYKQISVDEHKEKCGSEAMIPIEYSASPCSGPMMFYSGVAAA